MSKAERKLKKIIYEYAKSYHEMKMIGSRSPEEWEEINEDHKKNVKKLKDIMKEMFNK